MEYEFYVTSNSPGELSSWVRVFIPELKERYPNSKIILALVPCPYASGQEFEVAKSIPGIDEVWTPRETIKTVLGLRSVKSKKKGAVIFLGGELWHALGLSWWLGLPRVAYLERWDILAPWFNALGFGFHNLSQRLPGWSKAASSVVGNLMVDVAAKMAPEKTESSVQRPPVLALFPGSRMMHLKSSLAPFLRIAEKVRDVIPQIRVILPLSPFLRTSDLQEALDRPFALGVERAKGQVDFDKIITDGGLQVEVISNGSYRAIQEMDVALCIPGTNNSEIASFGKPFVIALHRLAVIGGGGLFGLLELLPLPTSWKTYIRNRKKEKLSFIAPPNRIAQKRIAPEVFVQDSLDPVAEVLIDILQDSEHANAIGSELRLVMGEFGVARRFVQEVVTEVVD